MDSLTELIAAHPFFQELSPEHVGILAEYAMKTRFAAGEALFEPGDIANRFYALMSGCVALRGAGTDAVELMTLREGDVLGWSWLFPPFEWHFSARAVEDTDAIFFYATPLRERCEQDHHFGYEVLKRISAVMIVRLQLAREELARQQRH